MDPPSACCIVNGVCKTRTTLLLRAYRTRRHTMRSAANCTRRKELCGFFSHRMSSLRKRPRPSLSLADTSACWQGRHHGGEPGGHDAKNRGPASAFHMLLPFRPIPPRFEGPYRRRRPGGQGASHDVPGVIWSRLGGCNPSHHGYSCHRMAIVGRAAGARQSCDRGGTARHVHVRRHVL